MADEQATSPEENAEEPVTDETPVEEAAEQPVRDSGPGEAPAEPVADWKRRLNSSWRRSCNAFSSSSSVMSLMSLALKEIRLSFHELGLHGELRPGQAKRLLGERFGHAGELEHDAAGLHDCDPVLR